MVGYWYSAVLGADDSGILLDQMPIDSGASLDRTAIDRILPLLKDVVAPRRDGDSML